MTDAEGGAPVRDVRLVRGKKDPQTGLTGVHAVTPFDRHFVDALKAAVPGDSRAWYPRHRIWFIADAYADRALELVVEHFGETRVVTEDGAEEYLSADGNVTARQERLF